MLWGDVFFCEKLWLVNLTNLVNKLLLLVNWCEVKKFSWFKLSAAVKTVLQSTFPFLYELYIISCLCPSWKLFTSELFDDKQVRINDFRNTGHFHNSANHCQGTPHAWLEFSYDLVVLEWIHFSLMMEKSCLLIYYHSFPDLLLQILL